MFFVSEQYRNYIEPITKTRSQDINSEKEAEQVTENVTEDTPKKKEPRYVDMKTTVHGRTGVAVGAAKSQPTEVDNE